MDLINIFIKAAFVENMVLIYFLGMCSFLAVSKTVKTALGLGAAVVFVLGITAPINWLIREYILIPNELLFLDLIVYIAVIASMVQVVEMVVEKFSPSLYMALGIFCLGLIRDSVFVYKLLRVCGTEQKVNHCHPRYFTVVCFFNVDVTSICVLRFLSEDLTGHLLIRLSGCLVGSCCKIED